jgi:hypothetical protein
MQCKLDDKPEDGSWKGHKPLSLLRVQNFYTIGQQNLRWDSSVDIAISYELDGLGI